MWIVSKKYDLAFIFGGAAVSLLVPFIAMQKPVFIPLMFWIWVWIFDGTHLYATLSSTYFDRQFWKNNRALLVWSPAVILLPLIAVAFYLRSGSTRPIEFFLLFAQAWAYYHLVRQHYGFISLYDRKSGVSRESHEINKQTVYVGLWTPYVYFLLSHPVNRKIVGLPSLFPEMELLWGLNIFAIFFTGGAALLFLAHYIKNKTWTPAGIFTAICVALYSLIFYWIAPMEPLFARAQNVVQSFMIIAITMTVFHNIQYHAIVWHFNRNKYGHSSFGLATILNRNFLIYAAVAILFAGIYSAVAWFTTDYPSLFGTMSESDFVPIAFCVWWGLLFHHYFLNHKICHFSKSKDLQEQLGIEISSS